MVFTITKGKVIREILMNFCVTYFFFFGYAKNMSMAPVPTALL